MRCSGYGSGSHAHHVRIPRPPVRRISRKVCDRSHCNGCIFASLALVVLDLFASTSGFCPWCIDWHMRQRQSALCTFEKQSRKPPARTPRAARAFMAMVKCVLLFSTHRASRFPQSRRMRQMCCERLLARLHPTRVAVHCQSLDQRPFLRDNLGSDGIVSAFGHLATDAII